MKPVLANMIWASLFLEQRLFSLPVILLGLLIEFFFVRRATGLSLKKSMLANLAMNAASLLPGILLIPLSGIIYELVLGQFLYDWFGLGSFSSVSWTITFLLAVLINAVIETLVLARGFKQKMGRRGFGWMFFANALSVAVAMVSFLIFPAKG
jgi:hypothetical protein